MRVTPEEIRKQVAAARNRGAMLTNFFPNPARLDEWCAAECLTLVTQGETLFLLRDQEAFVTLYFVTPSAEALGADTTAVLATLPGRRVIIDVVGADAMRLPLHHALEGAGFKIIGELQRMGRKTPQEVYDLPVAAHAASETEAQQVFALLTRHFDAEREQLPSKNELEALRVAGGVWVVCDEAGAVLAFSIFERTAASCYLRYWFTAQEARGRGIGGLVLRAFFAAGATAKRQHFWVFTDNAPAIVRYEHYGFAFEPMKDIILARDVPPTKESDHA